MRLSQMFTALASVYALSSDQSYTRRQSTKIIVEWRNDILIESILSISGYESEINNHKIRKYIENLPSRHSQTKIQLTDADHINGEDFIRDQLSRRLIETVPMFSVPLTVNSSIKEVKRLNALGIDIIEVDNLSSALELMALLKASNSTLSLSLDSPITSPSLSTTTSTPETGTEFKTPASNSFLPNDPLYQKGKMWHMDAIGMPDVWASHNPDLPPSTGRVLAVIDSGLDPLHEDLANRLWVNEGEIPNNGLDDDGNGYVDDYHGYSFGLRSGTTLMAKGDTHGAHVSGTVLAEGNNGLGVVGVGAVGTAHRVMTLNYHLARDSGSGGSPVQQLMSNILEALNYAVGMGADVTNNSWGVEIDNEGDTESVHVVANAYKNTANSIVHVFAAGNHGNDLATHPLEPQVTLATASAAILVGGAARDPSTGEISPWPFSVFNPSLVSVCAPSTKVMSTMDVSIGYYHSDGTSMAAPHVSGTVLLMLDHADKVGRQVNPDYTKKYITPAEIRAILKSPASANPGTSSPAFQKACAAGGVLNVPRALQLVEEVVRGKLKVEEGIRM